MTLKLSEIDFAEVSRILEAEQALSYSIDPDWEDPADAFDPPAPLSAADAAEVERLAKVTD